MASFPWFRAFAIAVFGVASVPFTAAAASDPLPTFSGPIPGDYPGDPKSNVLEETYPFYSTPFDLASRGYVEEEYHVAGVADGWSTAGVQIAVDVPYTTRIVVRRPVRQAKFNGTVLVEWQNVTGGVDIDSLWFADAHTRAGYVWVGVSNQRSGIDYLRTWSPVRYGTFDVTGGDNYPADELSYDIFAQVGRLVRARGNNTLLRGLNVATVLAIGSGESADRISIYYDRVLPQVQRVFDGYGVMVGGAPTRAGTEPVFQVVTETNVISPVRPADTDKFRRWEVAGSAPANWVAREYREPISVRDKGPGPGTHCEKPPFGRVPWQHVAAASFDHLVKWARRGTLPPTAPPLLFNPDGTRATNELGMSLGGIRLSHMEAPIGFHSGDNRGGPFCTVLGAYVPYDEATLDQMYPTHVGYVARVVAADLRAVRDGYLLLEDARKTAREAAESDVGK